MNRKIFWPIFFGSSVIAFVAIIPLTEAPDTSPELVVFQQGTPHTLRVSAAQKTKIISEASKPIQKSETLAEKKSTGAIVEGTASWRAVQKQFPKLKVVRMESVPREDGKIENWVLFQTSKDSKELWIYQEGPNGAMAAQAGQLLIRAKNMDSVTEWREALSQEEVSLELASRELELYAVEFDPENLELYRQLVGRKNESASEALEPNYMVGVW